MCLASQFVINFGGLIPASLVAISAVKFFYRLVCIFLKFLLENSSLLFWRKACVANRMSRFKLILPLKEISQAPLESFCSVPSFVGVFFLATHTQLA
jgi:hypothetical protein